MNIYSVSEITKYMKNTIDHDPILSNIFLRGEISNFKCHSSGHCYFTLKDAAASIKVVMFKSKAQYLKFTPVNGMKVVANGYISIFERDGQYQLYIMNLFPEGIGELSLAFEQLKEKLTKEGLFDTIHKQELPVFPKTIGVITSATGSVLRDIYTVSKRRNPNVSLRVYPVQVQGEGSAEQIVQALGVFNTKYPVDVIVLARGGGSMEDLWSFNDERVVRAIYSTQIPVVSAIGHETDFTLSDFVSDVRAATPSQAAELMVPDAGELSKYIQNLQERLRNRVSATIRDKRSQLNGCLKNKALMNPHLMLDAKKQQLDQMVEKLEYLKKSVLTEKNHEIRIILEKLHILNPLSLVARGYSVVEKKGKILKSVKEVKIGERIEVTVSDGQIKSIVENIEKGVQA
ncbi:exodeoxyribonuclease VII large subunit [Anaerosinus massiliensis]|uniref:exodeoxyribonuclease VII large subunit n=1 Tax=Massilibacillus massiliensis TaxID=1806837 RepID=UPI000B2B8E73|nr:exodeoxyribonuclease VII large subunit [Massilibacillus massiliensis]